MIDTEIKLTMDSIHNRVIDILVQKNISFEKFTKVCMYETVQIEEKIDRTLEIWKTPIDKLQNKEVDIGKRIISKFDKLSKRIATNFSIYENINKFGSYNNKLLKTILQPNERFNSAIKSRYWQALKAINDSYTESDIKYINNVYNIKIDGMDSTVLEQNGFTSEVIIVFLSVMSYELRKYLGNIDVRTIKKNKEKYLGYTLIGDAYFNYTGNKAYDTIDRIFTNIRLVSLIDEIGEDFQDRTKWPYNRDLLQLLSSNLCNKHRLNRNTMQKIRLMNVDSLNNMSINDAFVIDMLKDMSDIGIRRREYWCFKNPIKYNDRISPKLRTYIYTIFKAWYDTAFLDHVSDKAIIRMLICSAMKTPSTIDDVVNGKELRSKLANYKQQRVMTKNSAIAALNHLEMDKQFMREILTDI